MSNFSFTYVKTNPRFSFSLTVHTLEFTLCCRIPYYIRVFQLLQHIATWSRSLLWKQRTSEKQHNTATLIRNLRSRWYEYSASSPGRFTAGILSRPKRWCPWNTLTNKRQCCPWSCHRATRRSVVMAPPIPNLRTRWSGQLHTPAALLPGQKPDTHWRGSWMGPTASLDVYEKREKKKLVLAGMPTSDSPVRSMVTILTMWYRIEYLNPAHTGISSPGDKTAGA